MILSALAVSTLMFAAAPDTALAYGEALARAERYEADAAANNWRVTAMSPLLGKAIGPIFEACASGPASRPNFDVVVSFKAGRFEAVRHTSDNPAAQCIADRLARLDWPTPPHPDFAEEIHLEMAAK